MTILYDIAYMVFALFYLPVFVLKKRHPGFGMRLGFLPGKEFGSRPIWIHAVSVGEAKAIRPIYERLKKKHPGRSFVLSTVTPTGNKVARSFADKDDLVVYLPLDISFVVKKVIDRVNPELFIIAETEIWPNMINYLHKKGAAIAVVNGRISDASFKGYYLARFFISRILNKVGLFCVQTKRDAERLHRIGAQSSRVRVSGNMKFDMSLPACDSRELRNSLGLRDESRLFLAGSTHPGEEKLLLQAYGSLKKDIPFLEMMIAPRHPERAYEVARLAEAFGFSARLKSLCAKETVVGGQITKGRVHILDTIGELINYYSASDIVFVGGSLVKKGGHNILEPALLGKPVLFGPYMHNFRDIAELFISAGAALEVSSIAELERSIAQLIANPGEYAQIAVKAGKIIEDNRGATLKTMEYLDELMEACGCLK